MYRCRPVCHGQELTQRAEQNKYLRLEDIGGTLTGTLDINGITETEQ